MPSSRVEFDDQAAEEYDAAFDWHLKRSADAALKFDNEAERALTQISMLRGDGAPDHWALEGSYCISSPTL